MTRELTHDEAFTALGALALDALDPAERDAVLEHVAGCEICRPELATLHAAAAQLAYCAPVVASVGGSRERIHSRLMDRVAADARARGVVPLRPPAPSPESTTPERAGGRSGGWRRAEWLAVAASVLFFVTGALFANAVRDRRNLRDALQAELARGQSARASSDSLRTVVALRDSMIAGLIGRDVAVVSLTASGAKAPFARMFWDTTHNTWTLVAHNMPALKAGRTYQLWLVTRTAKISAGTFEPTNGDAVVRATYPLARDSLQAIAITEEPAGGVPQPTGAMVVAGDARTATR
jgi:anti-sigma-K factor RskA